MLLLRTSSFSITRFLVLSCPLFFSLLCPVLQRLQRMPLMLYINVSHQMWSNMQTALILLALVNMPDKSDSHVNIHWGPWPLLILQMTSGVVQPLLMSESYISPRITLFKPLSQKCPELWIGKEDLMNLTLHSQVHVNCWGCLRASHKTWLFTSGIKIHLWDHKWFVKCVIKAKQKQKTTLLHWIVKSDIYYCSFKIGLDLKIDLHILYYIILLLKNFE